MLQSSVYCSVNLNWEESDNLSLQKTHSKQHTNLHNAQESTNCPGSINQIKCEEQFVSIPENQAGLLQYF